VGFETQSKIYTHIKIICTFRIFQAASRSLHLINNWQSPSIIEVAFAGGIGKVESISRSIIPYSKHAYLSQAPITLFPIDTIARCSKHTHLHDICGGEPISSLKNHYQSPSIVEVAVGG